MIQKNRQTIQLTEYSPKRFSIGEIPQTLGESLWRNYGKQVKVEFPSPITDGEWQLTAQGWVGYIPLSRDIGIALNPKVEIANLFRMLEYAYRLRSFQFLDGLFDCGTLEDFFERMANILARRILDRGRKGFYRTYVGEMGPLPYVCGRIDLHKMSGIPWIVNLHCRYQEHTSDIEENRILAWTLFSIARNGMCTERVLPTVRRAYRGLQGFVTLMPFDSRACVNRVYNRLNEDYQSLHAICRFFLENSGPSHEVGEHAMLPFLVDMERLYELFVAEWLREHLPYNLFLTSQEKVSIGERKSMHFEIDLVMYSNDIEAPLCVLDTKYKTAGLPSTEDIAQVVAYAEAKHCREAILVYPTLPIQALDELIGKIRIRALAFSLDSDLEKAGEAFLKDLLELE